MTSRRFQKRRGFSSSLKESGLNVIFFGKAWQRLKRYVTPSRVRLRRNQLTACISSSLGFDSTDHLNQGSSSEAILQRISQRHLKSGNGTAVLLSISDKVWVPWAYSSETFYWWTFLKDKQLRETWESSSKSGLRLHFRESEMKGPAREEQLRLLCLLVLSAYQLFSTTSLLLVVQM